MYAVTGASGQLGRLVVQALIEREVPAADIVALVRTPAKVEDLAAAGVVVRSADYDRPETLADALVGVDELLLVSGNELGRRLPQHQAIIAAAQAAGVARVAYTSFLKADTSTGQLASEHLATERELEGSGLSYTILRNAWYFENYLGQAGQYLAQGQVVSAAGSTPFGAAARSDYADAAAVVLTTSGHQQATYELAGGPITMADIAGAVTEASGTPVDYREVSDAELLAGLTGAGIPEAYAAVLVDVDRITREGEISTDSTDLRRLLGRPLLPLVDAAKAAVAALD